MGSLYLMRYPFAHLLPLHESLGLFLVPCVCVVCVVCVHVCVRVCACVCMCVCVCVGVCACMYV